MSGFPPDVRAIFRERAQSVCEVCGDALVQELHHRRPRGSGGSRCADTNSASNGLAICARCHRLVESHRNAARDKGWLVRQSQTPADIPVLYRGVWVWLCDSGNVTPVSRAERTP